MYKNVHYNFKIPYNLRILDQESAWMAVVNEPYKWNVVSLWSKLWDWENQKWDEEPPEFRKAKSVCQQHFADIDVKTEDLTLCNQNHIKDILSYARKIIGQPLIVHCRAGISRSTAIAFLILLDAIKDKSEQPGADALNIVYNLRPIMQPNKHIINIGVPLVARNEGEEIKWFRQMFQSRTMGRIRG